MAAFWNYQFMVQDLHLDSPLQAGALWSQGALNERGDNIPIITPTYTHIPSPPHDENTWKHYLDPAS